MDVDYEDWTDEEWRAWSLAAFWGDSDPDEDSEYDDL